MFDFLTDEFRRESGEYPLKVDAFPGEVFPNRVPQEHEAFAQMEIESLIVRACLIPWANVRTPQGPPHPRLIQALPVESSKSRLIYDARPLNACCRQVPFTMDSGSSGQRRREEML